MNAKRFLAAVAATAILLAAVSFRLFAETGGSRKQVARCGDRYYDSLAQALLEADGGTVTLLAGITLTEELTVNESVTLDINGQTLYAVLNGCMIRVGGGADAAALTVVDTSTGEEKGAIVNAGEGSCFEICAGCALTLSGGVTVAANAGVCISLETFARAVVENAELSSEGACFRLNGADPDGAALTIEGGAFYAGTFFLIGAGRHRVCLKGGSFFCNDGLADGTNENDPLIVGGMVKGGEYNLDPTDYVDADSKICAQSGVYPYRAEKKAYVAQLGSGKYEVFADAAADALETGVDLLLLADVAEPYALEVGGTLRVIRRGFALQILAPVGWTLVASKSVAAVGGQNETRTTYSLARTGDVNGDGRVNISDVSDLLNHLSCGSFPIDAPASDMDRSGILNIADVSLLLNYLSAQGSGA